MKNYKKWIAIGLGIIAVGLLIYFLIPHVKFWTLQGLSYEQKDRYHIVAENQTYFENYKMYWIAIRTKEFDEWLINRLMLDKTAVEKDKEKYAEGRDGLLRDYHLEYYFRKLQEDGDRTIYDKLEEALMRPTY